MTMIEKMEALLNSNTKIDCTEISATAYSNNAECYVEGKYIPATWESPAEYPDYYVNGYDAYISEVIAEVAYEVAALIEEPITDDLIAEVDEYLFDLSDDIMTEFEFTETAIEDYKIDMEYR